MKDAVERKITMVVYRAIGRVLRIEGVPDDAALVDISGLGFIGSMVVDYMRNNGFSG